MIHSVSSLPQNAETAADITATRVSRTGPIIAKKHACSLEQVAFSHESFDSLPFKPVFWNFTMQNYSPDRVPRWPTMSSPFTGSLLGSDCSEQPPRFSKKIRASRECFESSATKSKTTLVTSRSTPEKLRPIQKLVQRITQSGILPIKSRLLNLALFLTRVKCFEQLAVYRVRHLVTIWNILILAAKQPTTQKFIHHVCMSNGDNIGSCQCLLSPAKISRYFMMYKALFPKFLNWLSTTFLLRNRFPF